ncbi:MAG: GNAT family N-acetyltransferase [Chitinophagaceae bacterium]|nr:GNAT family N-acetyltransferase [Chitinophagaceae bacterium]
MVILETERLLLRESVEDDAQDFFDLTNDPEVMKYTGDVVFKSVEETRNLIRNYEDYQKNSYGRWSTIIKDTNEIIGWCGLKYIKEIDETDLGFRFKKKYWNKGYATEASIACLELGFNKHKLDQIVGQVYKEHAASRRVLEKVGMSFWKELYDDDESWLVYGIKKEDFRP